MSEKKRFDALDGLRGLAMILVFLTHINYKFISAATPDVLRPLVETVFNSGKVGIVLLFILSGFLIEYLHPEPKNIFLFIKKRYTRIFPLFITMVLVMTSFRLSPNLSPILRIGLILGLALIAHTVWVYGIQKLKKSAISSMIFLAFIGLQVLTALWYAFAIMRQPAIVFNQLTPAYIREGTISLVNATLMLPFGTYIPQLDGVYWALIVEVLFYLIYPLLIVPFVKKLSQQPKTIKIVFFLSLMPLLAGVYEISKHILGFAMIMPFYLIYFATGIGLGYCLTHYKNGLMKFISKFSFLANPVAFFLFIIVVRLSTAYIYGALNYWVWMLWALPITLFVAFNLNEKSSLALFLRSRFLIFIGMISYSIYLSHTAMVKTSEAIFHPNNWVVQLVGIVVVFICTILISIVLNHLLEKPYFVKSPSVEPKLNHSIRIPFKVIGLILLLLLFFGIFNAYQSQFNLLSYEKAYGKGAFQNPKIAKNTETLVIKGTTQVRLKIVSPEDRFGIVTARFSYKGPPTDTKLVFRIKPSNSSEWYAESTHKLNVFDKGEIYPFGFPLIDNSKGKTYDVVFSLEDSKEKGEIILDLKDHAITTVHQLDKKTLLHNPLKFLGLLESRAFHVVESSEAQLVFLQLLPFIGFTLYLSFF